MACKCWLKIRACKMTYLIVCDIVERKCIKKAQLYTNHL